MGVNNERGHLRKELASFFFFFLLTYNNISRQFATRSLPHKVAGLIRSCLIFSLWL